jgi:cytosine deaminase
MGIESTVDLFLSAARIEDGGPLRDIAVGGGVIRSVAEHVPSRVSPDSAQRIDCGGHVVIPGLVETHLHLDKALLAERATNRSGKLTEAISASAALKPQLTPADIRSRAEKALGIVLRHGTTTIRAQTEFDPVLGLSGIVELLELKRRYAPLVDLQVVAFPQEGVFQTPGTEELFWQAMELGSDVVGGVPYNDTSAERHIDLCFQIAQHYDRPLSFHQDFRDDANGLSIEYLAHKTIASGWQGRVEVGHATGWSALEPRQLDQVIEALLRAQISVVTLPFTDLHLGARNDRVNVRRALTPVKALIEAGVNVAASTNNLRNAFTPFGSGDLLHVALTLIPAAHLGSADLMPRVLDLVTTNAARAIGVADYGVAPGCRADLIVCDTFRVADVIQDVPERLYVVKNGWVTHVTRVERARTREPLAPLG